MTKFLLACLFALSLPLYDRDNGSTVDLDLGDEMVVKVLVANEEGGIAGLWTLSSNNAGVLLRGKGRFEDSRQPGTMFQVFVWRGVSAGNTEIRLQYTGNGTYVPPRSLYTLKVRVR